MYTDDTVFYFQYIHFILNSEVFCLAVLWAWA